MSVGSVTPLTFYVPSLTQVAAVKKIRRVTRGTRVKGNRTFQLSDGDEGDGPILDSAAASTAAATLAALDRLTRGG